MYKTCYSHREHNLCGSSRFFYFAQIYFSFHFHFHFHETEWIPSFYNGLKKLIKTLFLINYNFLSFPLCTEQILLTSDRCRKRIFLTKICNVNEQKLNLTLFSVIMKFDFWTQKRRKVEIICFCQNISTRINIHRPHNGLSIACRFIYCAATKRWLASARLFLESSR